MKPFFLVMIAILGVLLSVTSGLALTPDEILVVVNKNGWHSIDLGKYYMDKRNIPEDNILKLWASDSETISREEYEKQVAAPIARFLKEKTEQGKTIRCLVLMFGLPLRISPPELSKEEKKEIAALKEKQESINKSLAELEKGTPEQEKLTNEQKDVSTAIKRINDRRGSKGASLDSELSLLQVPDYPLEGWTGNPIFLPFQKRQLPVKPESILLVSRLDGPSEATVRRMIADAIATEEKGLQGKAYLDARWKAPQKEKAEQLQGTAYYDWSIHQTADFFRQQNIMPVVLDDNEKLFQKGEAPDAAIYCGWYSLSNYVDAFTWQPGAVGFHIASGECASFRTNNNQWCRKILENGAAATLGPVSEPYLQAIPIPELFFKLLAEGRFNLVESYYLSLPVLSWQMILVGDPLYRPFKKRNQAVN